MKYVRKLKIILLIFTFSILISGSVFAEEIPVDIPKEGQSTVSQEEDTATNEKPSMGTDFYMYIPADIINDYPDMGYEGFSMHTLIVLSIASGAGYLLLSKITYEYEKNSK